MPDYGVPVGLIILTLLLGAWREHRSDNPRDAKLLAAFGLSGTIASTTVWLV